MCHISLSWLVIGFRASYWEALQVELDHSFRKSGVMALINMQRLTYLIPFQTLVVYVEVQLQIFAVTYSFVWRYPNNNNSLSRIHFEMALKESGEWVQESGGNFFKNDWAKRSFVNADVWAVRGTTGLGRGWILYSHLQAQSVLFHQGKERKVLILANWSLEALDLILKISVGSNKQKNL